VTPAARSCVEALRLDLLATPAGHDADVTMAYYRARVSGRGREYSLRQLRRALNGRLGAAAFEVLADAIVLTGAPHLAALIDTRRPLVRAARGPAALLEIIARESAGLGRASLHLHHPSADTEAETGAWIRRQIALLRQLYAHWSTSRTDRPPTARRAAAPRRDDARFAP